MRSPEHRAAFKAIDDSGGIYNSRWGDAPIRTMIALAILPLDQIHQFNFGGNRKDALPRRKVNPGYPEEKSAIIVKISEYTGTALPASIAQWIKKPSASKSLSMESPAPSHSQFSSPSPWPVKSPKWSLPPISSQLPTSPGKGFVIQTRKPDSKPAKSIVEQAVKPTASPTDQSKKKKSPILQSRVAGTLILATPNPSMVSAPNGSDSLSTLQEYIQGNGTFFLFLAVLCSLFWLVFARRLCRCRTRTANVRPRVKEFTLMRSRV